MVVGLPRWLLQQWPQLTLSRLAVCLLVSWCCLMLVQQYRIATYTSDSMDRVALESGASTTSHCVAFRHTQWCHPYGKRTTDKSDIKCKLYVTGQSGYCECQGNLTVAHSTCGPHVFRCYDQCLKLRLDESQIKFIPDLMSCPGNASSPGPRHAPRTLWGRSKPPPPLPARGARRSPAPPGPLWHHVHYVHHNLSTQLRSIEADNAVRLYWEGLGNTLREFSHDILTFPGKRTNKEDWVVDGLRMDVADVAVIKEQVSAYRDQVPTYPAHLYKGRGIVIVGGGLKYMVSAWINVHLLRRAGCTLPVEMWFPISEQPTPHLEATLGSLGVSCRLLAARDIDQVGPTRV